MNFEPIREAYDSVTPDAAAMDRMEQRLRDALPKDTSGPRRYSAMPERECRRPLLPAAAACLALLMLGSLVLRLGTADREEHQLNSTPSSETTETTGIAVEETQAVMQPEEEREPTQSTLSPEVTEPAADSPFGPGSYRDYVSWIRSRNAGGIFRGRDTSSWYAYYDLNGDGVRDLLIGDKDGWINEAITCIDGELSLLFGVGRGFRVCENGAILTGGEEDSHYVIYRMSGLSHTVSATIWFDEEQEQWYFYVSAMDETRAITEADAVEILESYVSVDLTMGKLSSFQLE